MTEMQNNNFQQFGPTLASFSYDFMYLDKLVPLDMN